MMIASVGTDLTAQLAELAGVELEGEELGVVALLPPSASRP
jgi:hypothetical protein